MSEANLPVSKRRVRRRWWIAAIILMFIAAYPSSEGPAVYTVARNWLPSAPYQAAYGPLEFTIGRTGLLANLRDDYRLWWIHLGNDHRTASIPVTLPRQINGREVQFHYFDAPNVENELYDLSDGAVLNRDENSLWFEFGVGRRLIVEENRILWNGEVIAKIPKTAKLVEIKYIQGESEVEINGDSIPLDE